MTKMFNQNITQSRTQARGVGVIIGRCFPDSQHGRIDCHPANVGYSFFGYTNDDLRNSNKRRKPQTKNWNVKVTIIPSVIGIFGKFTKGLLKGLEDLKIRGREDTIVIENSQNTERCPGDFRRLAVTQTPGKNSNGVNLLTINNHKKELSELWTLLSRLTTE